jgi:hypothetical protein
MHSSFLTSALVGGEKHIATKLQDQMDPFLQKEGK